MTPETFTLTQDLILLGVGLFAGLIGGLLGVGGGIIMIPAMVIFLGNAYGQDSFHIYKLAAISTSFVLSFPATYRHAKAKAPIYRMLPGILPLAGVGVIVGVIVASTFVGQYTVWLKRIFGAFLELAVISNFYQEYHALRGRQHITKSSPMPHRRLFIGSLVGLPAGFCAGLLGIGGGVWAVPMQRQVLGIRIRNAIANSAFMVMAVAVVTSVSLTVSITHLPDYPQVTPWSGFRIALWLAPGALLGGWLGAGLTHKLPVRGLRYGFQVLLIITGLRLMLG